MKLQENYLYCNSMTTEPNNADKAVLIPSSKVICIAAGETDAGAQSNEFTLFFEGMGNDGTAGSVQFAIPLANSYVDGVFAEAVDDIINAINSNPSNSFVTLADGQNGVFASPHVTSCAVDDEV
tara:strand:+ start:882 stop:1253 length:372 start_codon:yes stop_codon:yes gene_type:complete